jgi:hypothetical protein
MVEAKIIAEVFAPWKTPGLFITAVRAVPVTKLFARGSATNCRVRGRSVHAHPVGAPLHDMNLCKKCTSIVRRDGGAHGRLQHKALASSSALFEAAASPWRRVACRGGGTTKRGRHDRRGFSSSLGDDLDWDPLKMRWSKLPAGGTACETATILRLASMINAFRCHDPPSCATFALPVTCAHTTACCCVRNVTRTRASNAWRFSGISEGLHGLH